ncbi:MAG: crossover junction endodeoxyribonuclease RuvC [Puniceicoccales bacterium]|jgi:crossover junction endodeoxyribonuclease RuvC|nr:crossover junction endodeoxyribonuclease RuvC [Puniceicoccales bacterium]
MGKKSARHMWTEKLSKYDGKFFLKNDAQTSGNISISRKFKGVVMGIDASLRGTGVAIVDFRETQPILLFSKRITCQSKLSFFQCIDQIFKTVSSILQDFSIDHAAIEQTVYVQNYRISHILGSAKGAIIAALMNNNLQIAEYAPLRIKQAVVGIGRASKEQIKRTVCNILKIEPAISYDESDAIAVAFCHAWTSKCSR